MLKPFCGGFYKNMTSQTNEFQYQVKRFPMREVQVPGVEHYVCPIYPDYRGTLFETFHCLKMDTQSSISSIFSYYLKNGKVYGPVSKNGSIVVFMIRGKGVAYIINPRDLSCRDTIDLLPGMSLRIPSGVIHAIISLDDSTIINEVRADGTGDITTYDINDAQLAIRWPEIDVPIEQTSVATTIKEKMEMRERPHFAIMGYNGLIGGAFVREIEKQGYRWEPINARLHQHEKIRNEILTIKPSISVIIAAGVGTRPNTRWCDEHHEETLDANVTSQIAIAQICKENQIHCTLIGTSAFYHYDDDHPIGGKGFDESEAPNHAYNWYYKMRVLVEQLLSESKLDQTVLNLRAIFPLDHLIKPASLIGKLLSFKLIKSIPSSITVLNSLVPLAIEMMKSRDTGNVNWVCEGTISNGGILRAYQKIVDPNFVINEEVIDQQTSWNNGNAAAYIIPKRLHEKFGDKVPKVDEAIESLMQLIVENK